MISSVRQSARPRRLIKQFWSTHPPLMVSALVTCVMLLFFISGIFLDNRTITGAPAWLKPAKFALSISVYSFTMLWLIGFINTTKRWRRRLVNVLGWVVLVTFAAEWLAVITQVVRGTTSHFNVATPLDSALWALMAVAIMVLWLANFVVAGLLFFQKFEDPAFAWSLRLALVITIVGMGLGYLMTSPTAQQMAGWQAGEAVTVAGAHSVGVADGGAGLPVVGWSTEGGDLRVGHFIGMHALQVIPFLGLVIVRRRWQIRQQVVAIWTAALAYLALTLLVTWQALRAQPITQPDGLTLGVFAGIVGVAALVLSLALLSRKARVIPQAIQD